MRKFIVLEEENFKLRILYRDLGNTIPVHFQPSVLGSVVQEQWHQDTSPICMIPLKCRPKKKRYK